MNSSQLPGHDHNFNIFSAISSMAQNVGERVKSFSEKLPSQSGTAEQQGAPPNFDKSKFEEFRSSTLGKTGLFVAGGLTSLAGSVAIVATLPLFALGGIGGWAVGSLVKLVGGEEFKHADKAGMSMGAIAGSMGGLAVFTGGLKLMEVAVTPSGFQPLSQTGKEVPKAIPPAIQAKIDEAKAKKDEHEKSLAAFSSRLQEGMNDLDKEIEALKGQASGGTLTATQTKMVNAQGDRLADSPRKAALSRTEDKIFHIGQKIAEESNSLGDFIRNGNTNDRDKSRARVDVLREELEERKSIKAMLERPHVLSTGKVHPGIVAERLADRKEVLGCYVEKYRPCDETEKNMQSYLASNDFERHEKTTAYVFNSKDQMVPGDAVKVMQMRVPTNLNGQNHIAEGKGEKWKELTGSSEGAYYDADVKKADGSAFKDRPNTVCKCRNEYIFREPGNYDSKVEVVMFSAAAPPLDSAAQPHAAYYVENPNSRSRSLKTDRYENEMNFIAQAYVDQAIARKKNAFGENAAGDPQGIKRVVISSIGQKSFLGMLNPADKEIANQCFIKAFSDAIIKNQESLKGMEICVYRYAGPGVDDKPSEIDMKITEGIIKKLSEKGIKCKVLQGEIVKVVESGDFLGNAWDQHSVVGNGNKSDPTLDGVLGNNSTATHFNPKEVPNHKFVGIAV